MHSPVVVEPIPLEGRSAPRVAEAGGRTRLDLRDRTWAFENRSYPCTIDGPPRLDSLCPYRDRVSVADIPPRSQLVADSLVSPHWASIMKPNPTELSAVAGSKDMFVFFGGIAAGIVIPPFEFYSAAQILDASRLFIRDLDQCWYQTGVPGVSRDIDETAQFIRDAKASLGAERLVLVGNSMGGFAALLFAALIPDCRAVAFSPQTFISPLLRLWHRDRRWYRSVAKAWRRSVIRPHVWDLLTLLMKRMPAANSATVFAASGHRLDRLHAERLRGVPGVTIRLLDGDGHNLVRGLRDRGELPAIIAGTDGATDSPCRGNRMEEVA